LPIDVEFIESEELSLRAGGAPNYVLKISHGWFHWLITAVVEASCNKEEFAKNRTANKAIQRIGRLRPPPADFFDRLTASCAHVQPIGGGCFAIALTGSAHAPPIKAIEPTAPQS